MPERFDFEAALEGGEGLPLTSDRAVLQALATSPTLERATAVVAVAEAAARLSWSELAPHVELSATYSRVGGFEDGRIFILGSGAADPEASRNLADSVEDPAARQLLLALVEQQDALRGVRIPIPRDQVALRAELAIPISDWFAIVMPRIAASQSRVRAEQHAVEAARSDVALAAEETFYRYVQARGALAVSLASEQRGREHVARVQAMLGAGLATEVELLEAQSRLAASQSSVARSRAGVEVSAAALASLLHVDAPQGFRITEPLLAALEQSLPPRATLERHALEARAEIRAMEAMEDSLAREVEAAEGGRYPRVSITGGYEYSHPNRYIVPPQARFDDSWHVGVGLRWSVDGAVRAQLRADQIAAERGRARAELDQLRDRIRTEVAEAHARHRAAGAVVRSASAALRAAESAYDARVAELEAGGAVVTEVLDADLAVARARLGMVEAVVEARIAAARLAHAAGRRPRYPRRARAALGAETD